MDLVVHRVSPQNIRIVVQKRVSRDVTRFGIAAQSVKQIIYLSVFFGKWRQAYQVKTGIWKMTIVGKEHVHVVIFELFLIETVFAKVVQTDLKGDVGYIIWIVCCWDFSDGFPRYSLAFLWCSCVMLNDLCFFLDFLQPPLLFPLLFRFYLAFS